MIDIFEAIRLNDLQMLTNIIKDGTPLNEGFNEVPLIVAADCKNLQAVELLLEAGADPNIQDSSGETALTNCTDWDLLHRLISSGASTFFESPRNGFTSVHNLAERGDLDGVRLLLEPLMRTEYIRRVLERFDNVEKTPLMYAVESRNYELIRYLIDKGANVNALDSDRVGTTAIYLAVKKRDLEAIEILMKSGADPHLQVGLRKSAVELANSAFPVALQLLISQNLTRTTELTSNFRPPD